MGSVAGDNLVPLPAASIIPFNSRSPFWYCRNQQLHLIIPVSAINYNLLICKNGEYIITTNTITMILQ